MIPYYSCITYNENCCYAYVFGIQNELNRSELNWSQSFILAMRRLVCGIKVELFEFHVYLDENNVGFVIFYNDHY